MRVRRAGAVLAVGALLATAGCGLIPGRGGDGQTVVSLHATAPDGRAASAADLATATQIMQKRLRAAGFSKPTVVVASAAEVTVTIAGKIDVDQVTSLVRPAFLAFRQVRASTGQVSAQTNGASQPVTAPGNGAALAEVRQRLGAAYALAEQYVAQAEQAGSGPSSPTAPVELAAFATLTPAEVAVLPPEFQFFLPTVTCGQLQGRPAGTATDPEQRVVACGQGSEAQTKYLLDVAKVVGTDVAGAKAANDAAAGGWYVLVSFTADGQRKWTALTQQVVNDGLASPEGTARVAMVLDNDVLSAPTVQGVITGDAQISGGGLDKRGATLLAGQLGYGALPVVFTVGSVATS